MPSLDVRGASLFYETHGSGPLLLLIPGGAGSGDTYQPIAAVLAAKYTAVTYDRRGFSRSELKGEQDYSVRLQTDVDDAHTLIKHLSPDGTAIVFGSSSGAIIALSLLLSYPESIRTLIPHEPPLCDLLPDKAEWVAFFNSCYETFKSEGRHAAFVQFMNKISGGMELQMARERMSKLTEEQKNDTTSAMAKNQAYWFEHELRQYPSIDVDLERLGAVKDKLLLAAGKGSEGTFPYWPIQNLGKKLDLPVLEFPGGHVAYLYMAEPWAKVLMDGLEKRVQ